MSEAQTSSVQADLEKIRKVGRGKRDLILIAALLVVAILVGATWFGFRGNHVSQSADAITIPGSPAVPRPVPPGPR